MTPTLYRGRLGCRVKPRRSPHCRLWLELCRGVRPLSECGSCITYFLGIAAPCRTRPLSWHRPSAICSHQLPSRCLCRKANPRKGFNSRRGHCHFRSCPRPTACYGLLYGHTGSQKSQCWFPQSPPLADFGSEWVGAGRPGCRLNQCDPRSWWLGQRGAVLAHAVAEVS